MIIHDPGNEATINEIYVFLSVDAGGEGIVATGSSTGLMMPMFFANHRTLESAKKAVKTFSPNGKKIRIAKFSHKEIIDEFTV